MAAIHCPFCEKDFDPEDDWLPGQCPLCCKEYWCCKLIANDYPDVWREVYWITPQVETDANGPN